ncbi:MAG: hypothetical protein CL609_13440 [Anaerolineaceae bacterium]|nr:hypothetical protein [Anaerolineaceae bacterium]
MRKYYDRQEFIGFVDRNSAKIYSDLEFRQCRFISCNISITRKPKKRSVIRNISFYNCQVTGCTIDAAIIEEVLISGLKTHNILQTFGAVFKRVKFEGNIGEIMLTPLIFPGIAKPKEQAAFDQANAAYYKQVDWALDISEARFVECDIRRIPAKLIRRDPATQVVIKREKALLGEWKKLDLSNTYWKTSIQFFLDDGNDDLVLVAPKQDPNYSNLLDGLKMLRDAGVAEPD